MQYINTGLLVNENSIKVSYNKNGKKQIDIADRQVLNECLNRIAGYVEKLNAIKAKEIDCKTVIDIITNTATDLSFTEYAVDFIRDIYVLKFCQ